MSCQSEVKCQTTFPEYPSQETQRAATCKGAPVTSLRNLPLSTNQTSMLTLQLPGRGKKAIKV